MISDDLAQAQSRIVELEDQLAEVQKVAAIAAADSTLRAQLATAFVVDLQAQVTVAQVALQATAVQANPVQAQVPNGG